jgi:SAM-dependent methyltransferase
MQLSKIKIEQISEGERPFKQKYEEYYNLAEGNKRGFELLRKYRYEAGNHPVEVHYHDTGFASYHIRELKPLNILDIGSFRWYIMGLLSYYDVTTLDIRERKSDFPNETVVTCDAKSLKFSDNSFDAVLSLGALPHFGLARYGDEFDLDADIKAFNEMIRVLKPGGSLIFSAAITRAKPTILFNAERVYNHEMIKEFCRNLECVEEKFIDRHNPRFCSSDDISTDPMLFDYYVGCWKKR